MRMTLDEIQEMFHQAFCSDMEHGIKRINEQESRVFTIRYPRISEAIRILMELEDEA